MKPERIMKEKAQRFYTLMLKRKAFLAILKVNQEFREIK